jgi:hypothetical protein
VIQHAHRLSGLAARKKLDESLRQELLAPAGGLRDDVKSLRKMVSLPRRRGMKRGGPDFVQRRRTR